LNRPVDNEDWMRKKILYECYEWKNKVIQTTTETKNYHNVFEKWRVDGNKWTRFELLWAWVHRKFEFFVHFVHLLFFEFERYEFVESLPSCIQVVVQELFLSQSQSHNINRLILIAPVRKTPQFPLDVFARCQIYLQGLGKFWHTHLLRTFRLESSSVVTRASYCLREGP
jgi:hypothetical protein